MLRLIVLIVLATAAVAAERPIKNEQFCESFKPVWSVQSGADEAVRENLTTACEPTLKLRQRIAKIAGGEPVHMCSKKPLGERSDLLASY